ncbi:GlxA family transcriptional regulator [Herbaspirillum sp. LeCh32-8]|uniref:GlxA family transcriptional regulator n=1 Tax=Herbaspirillum sp. LeCh32-8 TaxID=2821356 RepID=UPI001AEA611D|nr:GlxA family transcriptional regulator [Herbaspirillum sp. LeCh32-8]MBP0600837.1 GlxA family transcriptional regulator [Herbaspirillum sp. LeCh32-8]
MPTRDTAFLIFADCSMLDFTGPLSAFDAANRVSGKTLYRLTLLSEPGGMIRSSAGACVQTERIGAQRYDTLVVAGGGAPREGLVSGELRDYIVRAAKRSRRIAGVCTGAFVLAAAGVLDGRRATTHWRMAAKLQKMHPQVLVESDRIYSRDGAVWTSAGISAGIDLALALIEDDHGVELAKAVARELVVFHRRPGGQSQFSALQDMDGGSDRIRTALTFARENLHQELTVDILAEVACLSRRQFDRAFSAETGQTPAKAIEQMRAEAARIRIEESSESLEHIARVTGFGDTDRMRRACMRLFGQPPQALRRLARQAQDSDALAVA